MDEKAEYEKLRVKNRKSRINKKEGKMGFTATPVGIVHYGFKDLFWAETPNQAKRLVAAFNRAKREIEFKPESMGRTNRRRGHQFEREVAIALRMVYPKARRQLEYHKDDCKGVDIQGTGSFKFQCKKLKTYASINTIDEVECDTELGDVPVLVTAADGKPAMAVLPFEDLLRLIAAFEKV